MYIYANAVEKTKVLVMPRHQRPDEVDEFKMLGFYDPNYFTIIQRLKLENRTRPGFRTRTDLGPKKKKRKSEFSSPMSLFDNDSLLQYPDQNQNPTEPWFLLEPSHTDVPVVLGPPLSHVVLIAACLFCTWCV